MLTPQRSAARGRRVTDARLIAASVVVFSCLFLVLMIFSISLYPNILNGIMKPRVKVIPVGTEPLDKPVQYTRRVLSEWPSLRAEVFEGIILQEECEHIMSLARPYLTRSEVVAVKDGKDAGGAVSEVRTSMGMFLSSYEQMRDDVHRAIRLRISKATGYPPQNFESTQILRYQKGQFYKSHTDWFDFDDKDMVNRGGNRMCTCLCYLNTPKKGGDTKFTEVGVIEKAKQGNCVVFHDLHYDGTGDLHAHHEAMTVEEGEKWSMVFWIREHEFM